MAKVQVMTRTSQTALGSMGAGYAFLQGLSAQGHVPVPGCTSHTEALLKALIEILSKFPSDQELEVELTHRLWVLTFGHFGSAPEKLRDALNFLTPILPSLVSAEVANAVTLGLSRRRSKTTFSMCEDAGRYMTKEMSNLRPPGEVAAMRREAVKHGVFIIHRAVGHDQRMQSENDDLLEVRFPGIAGSDGLILQDRMRDITNKEMRELLNWASTLGQELGDIHVFEPLRLAAEDPGIFWSCVRHKLLSGWSAELQKGCNEAQKLRANVEKKSGCFNLDFPGLDRETMASIALMEVMQGMQHLPGGQQKGLQLRVIGNESEKGSVTGMQELERFLSMPRKEQAKLVEKLQEMNDKEKRREEKRKERGKPERDVQLIGQERCCWSCGNVEQAGRCLVRCRMCSGHLCSVPSCWSVHSGFCFRDAWEPEGENDMEHTVECAVLPVDQRVKPYVRPLPQQKLTAEKKLCEILQCNQLLPLVPLRGFQNGLSDALEDGSKISQNDLYLVQADWTVALKDMEVQIYGLTSSSGRSLNGQKGMLGAYHLDRDRWEVKLPNEQQAKLLKGVNLRGLCALEPPQNLRASTILTSLFDNTSFSNHPMKMPGPVDNRVVHGDRELGVRARGDVWVLRVNGSFKSASTLNSFSFTDFECLWGIFQIMQIPGLPGQEHDQDGSTTPFIMGTVMRKTPDTEQMLGQAMAAALMGDEADDSDSETDRNFLDTWDWMEAEAEEEPEPMLGAKVQLHSLQTAKNYNGAEGRIVAIDERVQVHLDMPFNKILRVKASNIFVKGREQGELESEPEPHDSLIPMESLEIPMSPRQHVAGSQLFIRPADLFFSQDSISSKFRNRSSIRDTLDQLLKKEIRKRDVEMMRIVICDDRPFSLSNRRLALYRLLQMAGTCKRVKVEIVNETAQFQSKFTTQCHGEKVFIRDTSEVVGRGLEDTQFDHPAIRAGRLNG